LRVQKRKEKMELEKSRSMVTLEKIKISREILALEIKKKDLSTTMEKARTSIKELSLEIDNLTDDFWRMKNGM